jgi:hypothetical protein
MGLLEEETKRVDQLQETKKQLIKFLDVGNVRLKKTPTRTNNTQKSRPVDELIEQQQKIKEYDLSNREKEQDIELKRTVAEYVFVILVIETLFLCGVLLLQGFGIWGFRMDNTTLNIFVPATIIQVSSMAIIITRYLFTHKKIAS